MRAALWLMALFAVAVAGALFAGTNPGTVAVFWPPYRVDLSLNLALLALALCFVVLHIALRTVGALMRIPALARNWRRLQRERAVHIMLLDSLLHLVAGRFVRARRAAESVVSLDQSIQRSGEPLTYGGRLRTLSHLLAAESAHALQDRAVRDAHFQLALESAMEVDGHDARDGVQLRRARWAFDDRDAIASLKWLDRLPLGAARRTLALRLRFKAARLAGQSRIALETARLLTKHRAFSEMAGTSIARGLAVELIRAAHDPEQLAREWNALDPNEQTMPAVAIEAASRLLVLGGDAVMSRRWLLPVWNLMVLRPDELPTSQRASLVRVLESGFSGSGAAPDADWLARIEAAQMANPRDAILQYLAGIACMQLHLWGKAQQMLRQSLSLLQDADLRRDAWRAMAVLAEQKGDATGATHAYREAAKR